MKGDIKPLKIPKLPASMPELIAHFKEVGLLFAVVVYDRAIHMCSTCGREGENEFGKKDSPSGRNRFCSEACEAVWNARWAKPAGTPPTPAIDVSKMSGDSPSVQHRKALKANRPKRPGPKCRACGNHPKSTAHKEACHGDE